MGELPSSPPNKGNQNLIEDARNALLSHYSSKSTNQTAVLLGLAIVFFADIQAYSALNMPPKWEQIVFLVPSVGLIIFVGMRAVGRLIVYGELATNVTHVKIADHDATGKLLTFDFEKLKLSSQDDVKKFKLFLRRFGYKEKQVELVELVVESIKKLDIAPTYLERVASSASLYFYLKRFRKKQSLIYRVLNIMDNRYFRYVYPIGAILFAFLWWFIL